MLKIYDMSQINKGFSKAPENKCRKQSFIILGYLQFQEGRYTQYNEHIQIELTSYLLLMPLINCFKEIPGARHFLPGITTSIGVVLS